MSGITRIFREDLEVVDLNIDDPSLDDTRTKYGITGRSQYVLVGPDDEVIQRWFGPLSFEDVKAEIETYLATLEA